MNGPAMMHRCQDRDREESRKPCGKTHVIHVECDVKGGGRNG